MDNLKELDARFLQQAIELASQNVAAGGGPFGALIVRAGEVISTGQNRVTRDNDPTAHAEVTAIRAAAKALGDFNLAGTTLYSSCEPCPMCMSSTLWARVDRVVFAADRHDAARGGFDDRAFYEVLATPREQWELKVEHRSDLETAFSPFEQWLNTATRVEY